MVITQTTGPDLHYEQRQMKSTHSVKIHSISAVLHIFSGSLSFCVIALGPNQLCGTLILTLRHQ